LTDADEDDDDVDAVDGYMDMTSAPSLDMSIDMQCTGKLVLGILPRTLPISSTHCGRKCCMFALPNVANS
jgi:hypothetical protein